MRGTRRSTQKSRFENRNTPAYAGNTTFYCPLVSHIEEHPRVCGEHTNEDLKQQIKDGTPPRMRGTLSSTTTGLPKKGNTPAYAGNTPSSTGRRTYHYGTPPRMRGTLIKTYTNEGEIGNTPAYAGNTE